MKVGDRVIVDEIYTTKDGGKVLKVKPFINKILKIQESASMGNLYLLADKQGNNSNVWYYEKQLKKIINESDDIVWHTWGDK